MEIELKLQYFRLIPIESKTSRGHQEREIILGTLYREDVSDAGCP